MKKGGIRARDYGPMILALVGCFLISPELSLAKDKPGAMLRLEGEGGRIVRGELLEVEGESLVILGCENMARSSENIRELRGIVIEKKSSVLEGLGLGFLAGAGVGAALRWYLTLAFGKQDDRSSNAVVWVFILSSAGALPGGILGALSGLDKSIDLTTLSDHEKKRILNKLATQSRFPQKMPAGIRIQPEAREPKSEQAAESAKNPPLSPEMSPAKVKPGAMLRLEGEGGRIVRGELLEVEGESLVILGYETMARSRQNIKIRELHGIVIEKKSSVLKGLGLGYLVAAGGGAVFGFLWEGNDPRVRLESALAFGIFLGPLGALPGGILGALSGLDQSIDLTTYSDNEKKKILNKLATQSRSCIKAPAGIKIQPEAREPKSEHAAESASAKNPPPSPIRVEVPKVKAAAARKHQKIHISLTPGYFASRGTQGFNNVIEETSFGVDNTYSYHPGVRRNPIFYIKDIRLEYSIRHALSLGISYSPLGLHRATGSPLDLHRVTGRTLKGGSHLNGRYSGNAYFLTVSYMPLPDAFLRKLAIKLGVGTGYSHVNGSLMTSFYPVSGEEDETEPYPTIDRIDFSHESLGLIALAEVNYFLNRTYSLGISADYKYVHSRIPQFQLKAPFSYSEGGNRMYEISMASGPSSRFNAGGLGIGLTSSLHF